VPGTARITRGTLIEVNPDTAAVRFVMDGVALMQADIDGRLLQTAICGRPVEEAEAYLHSLPAEVDPVLEIEPAWMVRVPWLPFRITIEHRTDGEQLGPT
jgi:hypothetical protein